MKANNTLNISDLANWIDFQLSTIIEGVSAGYTLGNNNSVWIDKGATVFIVSLATGEEIEIDSDDYDNAEEIAKAIISTLNKNTPTTMNEATAVEFSELSHAGQCTDIYLHNTAEIYERYTVEAIKQVVTNVSVHGAFMNWDTYPLIVKDWDAVKNAVKSAVKLVKKFDYMTPTAKDIEQVTRNYTAYIVECAQYQIETA